MLFDMTFGESILILVTTSIHAVLAIGTYIVTHRLPFLFNDKKQKSRVFAVAFELRVAQISDIRNFH